MLRRLLASLVCCAALAACGGGGSSGTTALPQTPTGGSTPGTTSTQSVSVTISIPAGATTGSAVGRHPLYVSVNTHSAAISIDGGKAVVANVSAGSPGCVAAAGGGRTCTVTVSAPVGSHLIGVTLYASTDGSGAALSQNTVAATIVAGTANVVKMVLDGVVASIVLTLGNANPPTGTAATSTLTVNLNDASGATIVGSDPLANPVTLTDSDTSSATSISPKTTLSSPADAAGLVVKYTGAVLAQAVIGATASGVPASAVTTATLTPQSATVNPTAFIDWPTYGFDSQRSGFNPSTTGITPASIANMHVAWQVANGGNQTQPIVATNIAGHKALIIIGSNVAILAYDGLTGQRVWSTTLNNQSMQSCGSSGVAGSVQYDAALGAVFVASGNGTNPNHVVLYKLNVATGAVIGSVDVTPTLIANESTAAHTSINLANGRIYLGTGSNCEGGKPALQSWRGRVVSVDPNAMTLLSTFYTTYGQGGNYGGGGVWGWGGVSADTSGNIYVSTGNGETAQNISEAILPPFASPTNEQAGFAEHLVKLSSDLSTVEGSDYPGFNFTIGYDDLDYVGTPVVYTPPIASGCGTLTATQSKGGLLVINNTAQISPTANTFALSVPSAGGYYIGNPGYSPTTGYLYAPIASSGNGSLMLQPGMAAIGGCGSSIAWHAQFGPDSASYHGDKMRSAPTATAGGVVFMGTPCTPDGNGGCGAGGTASGALWAVDATTGTVLGGGKPLVITGDNIRMAPSADGLWIWLIDTSGNMYGMTVDPSVQAVAVKRGQRVTQTARYR